MKNKLKMFLMMWLLFGSMFDLNTVANVKETEVTGLSESIKTIIKEKLLEADASITVRDRKTGEVIYDYNGQQALKPASNLKLLTTAAALDVLGMNYRFKTNLYTTGEISKGVLKGDVYLQGQGDPTLSIEDLQMFAAALKYKGIQKIEGRIVGDDKWFDDQLLSPGVWVGDESYYYAAPVSALTTSPNEDYDSGTILVEVTGTVVGEFPSYTVTPHIGDLQIVNEAKTVEIGNKNTVKIERDYQSNRIVISGNMPVDETLKDWVTVMHPTTHTLTMFKAVLAEADIAYTKEEVFKAATPENAEFIGMKQSMKLKDLIIPYMKLSNNSIADILVKTLGKEEKSQGTITAGLQVIREYGKSIQLNMADWQLEDGSGLSHENRVSSLSMSELLYKVQKDLVWFKAYYNSLPIAARAERMEVGTLKKRLKDPLTAGKVFAKTGSLTGVSTLSGYVEASSGRGYIFSILVQNKSGASTAIDEIVKVIAEKL